MGNGKILRRRRSKYVQTYKETCQVKLNLLNFLDILIMHRFCSVNMSVRENEKTVTNIAENMIPYYNTVPIWDCLVGFFPWTNLFASIKIYGELGKTVYYCIIGCHFSS